MSVFQLQIKRQKSTWKVTDIWSLSQRDHNFFYLNIFQKCLLIYDLFNTVISRVTLRTITHEWLLVEWWSKCCSVCETWCYFMWDFSRPFCRPHSLLCHLVNSRNTYTDSKERYRLLELSHHKLRSSDWSVFVLIKNQEK